MPGTPEVIFNILTCHNLMTLVSGREVVVVQAGGVRQSVSVDTCLSPGSACPGLATCSNDLAGGQRSLCVQRFTHQQMLAIPAAGPPCPIITAVKFPSGCVCHAQVDNDV